MSERSHVVSTQDSPSTLDARAMADVLAKDGQLLLPMLDLIEHAQAAINDLIDVMGRATIEAVSLMSAAQLAGLKRQGRGHGEPRRTSPSPGWEANASGSSSGDLDRVG